MAFVFLLISGCAEYEPVPRGGFFEREANRVSENLNKPVPPTPGVKSDSTSRVVTTSSGQPYIIGQGPSQDLFQGLSNKPLNLDLRFEDAEIREVATTILGDVLKRPYVIDTGVKGRVSLRVARNVTERGLMDALNQAVTKAGGYIRLSNGNYEIASAGQSTLDDQRVAALRATNPAVSIVPLKFARPSVVADLLKAMYPSAQITTDDTLNVVMVGGGEPQRSQIVSTAEVLDVDGMSNRTVAVFPITQGTASSIVEDLRRVYSSSSGAQGNPVEFVPLNRSNSVLVIARQRAALMRVEQLIRGIDQQRSAGGRRMYVIQLQYARAPLLANVLRDSLGLPNTPATANMPPKVGGSPLTQQAGPAPGSPVSTASLTGAVPPAAGGGGDTTSPGAGFELESMPLRIVANNDTNSLVVFATPSEYGLIQEAVRRLDAVPLQVLIEATIMDVSLNDRLQFGVQAFLQQTTSAGNLVQAGITASNFATMGATSSGFNFIFSTPGQVQAVVNALRSVTKVTVLSSPQVVTQDNQPAKLEVGSQVPITTQSVTNTTTANPAIVNSITYVQTGVILHVTPRVNSTGGVDLDIKQEVTDAPPANPINPNLTPTLNRRVIETRVSVQSTQTVALGGLITEQNRDERSRVPLLGDIPVVGWLFGQTNTGSARQELLVFLTPTVFSSPEEARNFSLELRRRIDSIWKKEGSPRRSP